MMIKECHMAVGFFSMAKNLYGTWRFIPFLFFSRRFLMKLDEYNFYLAQIIRGSKSKTAISEGKYETLFEKFLQIFGFCTL